MGKAGGERIGHAPVTTVYGDEVSSINPFVDTGRFRGSCDLRCHGKNHAGLDYQ